VAQVGGARLRRPSSEEARHVELEEPLLWSEDAGDFRREHRDEDPQAVLVADSFLLDDGRVRGWDEHRRRFDESCLGVGYAPAANVYERLAGILPAAGRWFPRVELVALSSGLRIRLHVRPTLARRAEITVWPVTPARALINPRHKGPDLQFLVALRAQAQARGAHEALMLDDDGCAIEGALSNLLWWEDDVLCAVPDDAPILPGVTRALLLRIARGRGQTVRLAIPRLADLRGREVWLTNSLHGVSRVSAWSDGAASAFGPWRAEEWHARLETFARPICTAR
jgi:branched-subunit amino acid aminotransferase/4-amino-4-deoxychorismate lyase